MLTEESRIVLPPAPAALAGRQVRAWREPVVIDTYEPDEPSPYPAYLDQRVYQGSSGAVYPMPFVERVSDVKVQRSWDAIHLENDYVRLMLLPELGGRIHVGHDTTRNYDFFYRNDVIKPALVGLLGPWVSGGVELNWPQHHRPATYLPTEATIEHEDDGSVVVWCSDHDPFTRMQGMHGVRLSPGSALVELRAHLVNRSDDVQTFLWWANVAAAVNDDYQAFFPTDVHVVADHAKRAVTSFPEAGGRYYGVDYPSRRTAERPDGDRLDWYRNIPVPTSYMCLGSQDDFFGGYDHGARAGFVHWADHRVSPGKKMWTWGDADFGHAWNAHLTDSNGPYIELMAGVFTDNQPDFAFLRPGETKLFSQYWYPIQDTGPVHQATRDAAVRLDVETSGPSARVRAAAAVTAVRDGARVVLRRGTTVVHEQVVDLAPGSPYVTTFSLDDAETLDVRDLELTVEHAGERLVSWRPRETTASAAPTAPAGVAPGTVPVEPATEPAPPEQIGSVDELYVTGLHLDQYRHATRSPEPYWLEALRRDPGDARTHVALAARRMREGLLEDAERHLRAAVGRLTLRNPNPRDGEAHYRLGLVLSRLGRAGEARAAFATASWDRAWLDPAVVASARVDLADGRPERTAVAVDDLRALVARSPGHVQARNLLTVGLRRCSATAGPASGAVSPSSAPGTDRARTDVEGEVLSLVRGTLALDPLDAWARDLADRLGEPVQTTQDPTILLDVALEHASAGEVDAALGLLARAAALPTVSGQRTVAPLAWLHTADLELSRGDQAAADSAVEAARSAPRARCFPSAAEDDALARLRRARPDDPLLSGLAGHRLYAAGRRDEAVEAWQASVDADASDPVVLRNLGVAAYNLLGDGDRAARCYAQARVLRPDDARLLYEADQLAGRRGAEAAERVEALTARPDLVASRDDLTVQLAHLLTALDRADEALDLLTSRSFQPWEGGEGAVLAAWDDAHRALAVAALDAGDPDRAVAHVRQSLAPVASLGEARHPLASTADLHLLLGDALRAAGRDHEAQEAWQVAAAQQGDVDETPVQACSERTAASVTALRRLGRHGEATRLRDDLARYVDEHESAEAVVDYFATSLPTMLLFADDVQAAHDSRVRTLRAQLALLDDQHSRSVRVLPAEPPARLTSLGDGHDRPDRIEVTTRYLERGGRPWFPVTGEVHYSRIPRERWSEVLGHARAGGLDTVATYVFWQAHEPTPGTFRWDGDLDLRAFVELAAHHGLDVVVRMGPWAHGEARYGGFPDWLVDRGLPTRTDDPAYLELVRAFYGQTIAQLAGLTHADGGPVVGAQVENELYDQPGHLATLRRTAEDLGLRLPLWTATGWGGAQLPGTLLPVYSAYADGFWEESSTGWPEFAAVHFRYSEVRDDLTVGADLREALDGVVVVDGAGSPADRDALPFATCELGGGMHVAYHRRPLVGAQDVASLALAKIGSGSVWQGYYMYAGGTQRVGPHGTEQESQATGYPNDVPTRSYDFYAPVGEHGQVRPHHHLLRRQHLWLADEGARLAAMTTTVGGGSDDPSELRWSVRSDGRSGYLFLTTYQPPAHPVEAQTGVQVTVALDGGEVTTPTRLVDLPAGVSLVWPLRLALTDELELRSATAQVVARLGDVVVLAATDGIDVELVLDGAVEVGGAAVGRLAEEGPAGESTVVTLTQPPGPRCVVDLPGVRVVVLDDVTANRLYRLEVAGRERLVLSSAPVYAVDGALVLHPTAPETRVSLLPAPTSLVVTGGEGDVRLVVGHTEPSTESLWGTWVLSVPDAGEHRIMTGLHPEATAPVPVIGGPMGRLSAPTDWAGAARVRVDVPAHLVAGTDRALLRVDWTGDVGRAWVAGRLVSDHFWHGRVWDVDLTPWRDEVAVHGVELELLPWVGATGVRVDPTVVPETDGLEIRSVDVVRVGRAVLGPADDSAGAAALRPGIIT